MAAPLSEFVIETVIRDGLGDLRANPEKLDDIFSKFNQAYFVNAYGQDKIDQIKQYVQNNQIKITHAFSQIPSKMAAYSIQLIRLEEDPNIQTFSNQGLDVDTSKPNDIIVPSAISTAYNVNSGRITIDPASDLSLICPGMLYQDASGNQFVIQSGNSNLSGNKFISILPQQTVALGAGSVLSPTNFSRIERGQVNLRETISLGVHAKNDVHLTKFLFYILFYIIKSRLRVLQNRGLDIDYNIGEMFDREDDIEGQNVYSRFISFNFLSCFDWDSNEATIIDCFDLTTKANDPEPSDVETITLTKEEE